MPSTLGLVGEGACPLVGTVLWVGLRNVCACVCPPGVTTQPECQEYDTLLMQLQRHDIACHILLVGNNGVNCGFGLTPDMETCEVWFRGWALLCSVLPWTFSVGLRTFWVCVVSVCPCCVCVVCMRAAAVYLRHWGVPVPGVQSPPGV